MTSVFQIEAMDCASEEQLIRKRFANVKEIRSLGFDLVNRRLTVDHEFGTDEPIATILVEIGLGPDAEACACCVGTPTKSRLPEIRLAVALVIAVGAEVVGLVTGNDHSLPVALVSVLAIALGGPETFRKAWVALRTFALNINFLMCLAVVGAFAIGSYPEAAMVIVLFAIAERIESFALDRARNAVRTLMQLAPDTALVMRDDRWQEVTTSSIRVGEIVRVRPGERIALDGEVVSGLSSVNQASITGESLPVERGVGGPVFAGTINETGVLEFRVTGAKGSTTLDRIIQTVQEAQGSRAATQRFVDSFARIYTPTVVVLAVVVAVLPLAFGEAFVPWLYKALVLLVIACPCALVISTPVTVVSGLAAAAKRGILIKGGVHLESGRKLSLIALDKTGTVTHGKPSVVQVIPLHSFDEQKARQIAASLDHFSTHPMAQAICAQWSGELLAVDGFLSLPGRGVKGVIGGESFTLGNHRLVEELGICCDHVHESLEAMESNGVSTVILSNGSEAVAVFALADTLRDESVEAIRELHSMGLRVAMLTGDNSATANAIGQKVGIDTVRSEMLPEAKLAAVEEFGAAGQVVGMVGDGVNDAPALARSTVGFAMGAAGSDTAIETADVALMDDDLRKVATFVRLSRLTGSILTQNIALALGIKFVFFGLALTGHATLWMAVFADMGASLLVIGNGLRVLRPIR